jgi:hypothetical protein
MESNMDNQQIPDMNAGHAALGLPPNTETLEEQCLEFGQALGLDRAVSVEVLEAALRDETYAHHLLASRRSPSMLKYLLAHPPKQKSSVAENPRFSNIDLAKRAAKALLRWGAVGFSVVDQTTLERRRAACSSCPHLIDPPDMLVYELAGIGEEQKICGLCGCSVRKKMKVPTESCPDHHPEMTGMNRWGEPWQEQQEK